MNKKVLITGGSGMLATDMARTWSESGYDVVSLSHSQLDITQADQVKQAIEMTAPDVVVHTPGIGVDACETVPEDGFNLHTWSAGLVGRQCQRRGAALVYISTCGLFGDEKQFNAEYEPVVLKTQYARSKFLGEQEAMRQCERSFIIRPGWLFGGSPSHNRNFVYQRYLEAKRAEASDTPVIRSASDKFGNPTATAELSAMILAIVDTQEYGLYHVTNAGAASRYDYVKCIVEAFGLTTAVEPVTSDSFVRSAPVPDCELLDNLNVKFLGLEPLGPWQEAIQRYVAGLPAADQV